MKALPKNLQDEVENNSVSDFDFEMGSTQEDSQGMPSFTEADIEENDEEATENSFDQFFTGDDIPSIENTEQFLIEQSLKKYDGNRRKASEVLGISERTLYRKLDQYGLE